MNRLFSLVAALCVVSGLGCAESEVGDPCAPARPGNQPCVRGGADGGSAGCFLGTEIYIETQSVQCRSRVCLVYKYDEGSDPTGSQRASHVYCTCRCALPMTLQSDQAVTCTCPDTYDCVSIAGEQYDEGVRGSYCVRHSTVTATR